MNGFEAGKMIKECLSAAASVKGNSLYGIAVENDPYMELEKRLPFILVEECGSAIITNPQGCPVEYLHTIELTCAVKGEGIKRDEYRMKSFSTAESAVNELQKLSVYGCGIFPREMTPGEVIIGSLKCSAVKLTVEIKTLFNDD